VPASVLLGVEALNCSFVNRHGSFDFFRRNITQLTAEMQWNSDCQMLHMSRLITMLEKCDGAKQWRENEWTGNSVFTSFFAGFECNGNALLRNLWDILRKFVRT
jgi:hypothetical protein